MSSILSKLSPEHVWPAAAFALVLLARAAPAIASPPEPAASSTPAENRAHAKRLFEVGQAHYDLGEYDEAIAAFREAYEISSAPALLYNIAQAHRLKSDCPRALQVYRHFVRLDPNSPHRLSAETHVATLAAQCEHKLAPATSSSTAAVEAPPPSVADDKGNAGPRTEPASAAHAKPAVQTTQRNVVIGLVSAGLALAGVATVLHVWNDSRFETWQNEDRAIYIAPQGADTRARQTANNELLGNIRRTDVITATLAVAAGTSLVAGGTLFFAWRPSSSSTQTGGVHLSWTASW
jgi:tetratricopeptide (TPR) repeat protein